MKGKPHTKGNEMYIVCWTEGLESRWEVISGLDAMQQYVSDLINAGVAENDIVCGEVTEDCQ